MIYGIVDTETGAFEMYGKYPLMGSQEEAEVHALWLNEREQTVKYKAELIQDYEIEAQKLACEHWQVERPTKTQIQAALHEVYGIGTRPKEIQTKTEKWPSVKKKAYQQSLFTNNQYEQETGK